LPDLLDNMSIACKKLNQAICPYEMCGSDDYEKVVGLTNQCLYRGQPVEVSLGQQYLIDLRIGVK
jgi:hypothetical protein